MLGLWSLVVSLTSMAGVGSSGFGGSIVKFIAKYNAIGTAEKIREVIETSFLSILVILIVLCVSVFLLFVNYGSHYFTPNEFAAVETILPYVLVSFVLSNIASVFQSSLDGLQNFFWKNVNLSLSRISYLVFAYYLIPIYNLKGLALAYTGHYFILLFCSFFSLRVIFDNFSIVNLKFSSGVFQEMLKYGYKFQLSTIFHLLIDPLAKLLLRHFGSFQAVGIYEVSSRLASQARGLVVSVFNIYVPVFAEMHELSREKINKLVVKQTEYAFIIGLSLFACVTFSLPIVSYLWFGSINTVFIYYSLLLIFYNVFSLTGVPAFFENIGSGKLDLNLVHLAIFGLGTMIFGLVFGAVLQEFGVILAFCFAGILANIFILRPFIINKTLISIFHREDGLLVFFYVLSNVIVYTFSFGYIKSWYTYIIIVLVLNSALFYKLYYHRIAKLFFKSRM